MGQVGHEDGLPGQTSVFRFPRLRWPPTWNLSVPAKSVANHCWIINVFNDVITRWSRHKNCLETLLFKEKTVLSHGKQTNVDPSIHHGPLLMWTLSLDNNVIWFPIAHVIITAATPGMCVVIGHLHEWLILLLFLWGPSQTLDWQDTRSNYFGCIFTGRFCH